MAFDEHAFAARCATARSAARGCADRVGAEVRRHREAGAAEAGSRLADLRAELDRRVERLVQGSTRSAAGVTELQLYDTSWDPPLRELPPPRPGQLPREDPPVSWLR